MADPVVVPAAPAQTGPIGSGGLAAAPAAPAPETEPATPARQTLADLELELFGPDPVLVRGKVERGSGSLYQRLSEADRAHYDAVEKLVEVESDLDAATAAVGEAEVRLAEQQDRVKVAAENAEKQREIAAKRKADIEAKAKAQADFEKSHAVA